MIRRPPRSTQSRSSAASDVYKRQGVTRISQIIVKPFRGPVHCRIQSLFVFWAALNDFFSVAVQFNSRSLSENFESIEKFNSLFSLHKIKHVATNVANPTYPTLSLWVHLQTRTLIVMPGAMANVTAGSRAAQRDVAANQVNDFCCLLNSIFDISSKAR